MKERPILFSAPMVRAILDGTKTQTRRVAKLTHAGHVKEPGGNRRWHTADFDARLACPYGQPGDRLWVREAWRTVAEADAIPPRDLNEAHRLWFEVDAPHQPGFGKYRPPMFMPRWASRITLEITGVRVERLQDISESDSVAEGVNVHPDHHGKPRSSIYSPVQAYRDLWESINGPDSLAENPLVWVVEFQPIDAATSAAVSL